MRIRLFLSTPSARRATDEIKDAEEKVDISIHALREEGDAQNEAARAVELVFLSTPSARRATGRPTNLITRQQISIHALREEGDVKNGGGGFYLSNISIHALREEGDPTVSTDGAALGEFLSTPSARRATAKTETKSLFSNKLYNILHEFRRALIYNGSKNYPNHAK